VQPDLDREFSAVDRVSAQKARIERFAGPR
jgi:hypothetical protein